MECSRKGTGRKVKAVVTRLLGGVTGQSLRLSDAPVPRGSRVLPQVAPYLSSQVNLSLPPFHSLPAQAHMILSKNG